MIKQNITPFIWPQKHKQLLIKVILMMQLNWSIAQIYQTYKKLLGKDLDTGKISWWWPLLSAKIQVLKSKKKQKKKRKKIVINICIYII